MTTTDYHLIERSTDKDLDKMVKTYLKDGWKLYGYPFRSHGGFYYQAVIKETK